MVLFRRLKTPFSERAPESTAAPRSGPRSAGEVLRQRREALGLDLAKAAAALRIRPAYLAALEAGQPDQLPGPTYALGFLRAYADYLGVDSTEVLRRYKQEATAFAAKPDLSFPMPLGERGLPGGGALLAALILAICGYGTWYHWSTSERARPERVAPVPAELLALTAEQHRSGSAGPHPAKALAAAPTTTPAETLPALSDTPGRVSYAATPPVTAPAVVTPSPISAISEAAPASDPAGAQAPEQTAPIASATRSRTASDIGDASTRIVIRATADSWVQVRNAGQSVLLARVLKPGETYHVPDQPGLSMRTGNAGGLEIVVDGRAAPSIGKLGMVRRNIALDPDALSAGGAVRE